MKVSTSNRSPMYLTQQKASKHGAFVHQKERLGNEKGGGTKPPLPPLVWTSFYQLLRVCLTFFFDFFDSSTGVDVDVESTGAK